MTFADAVRAAFNRRPEREFTDTLAEREADLQPVVSQLLRQQPAFAEKWVKQSFNPCDVNHSIVVRLFKEQREVSA